MSVFQKVLNTGEGKKIKALESLVPDINALEPETKALSDDALRARTGEFRQRLENGEDLHDLLIDAFAVVREAAWRVIGQRHYDVQLMPARSSPWGASESNGKAECRKNTWPSASSRLSEPNPEVRVLPLRGGVHPAALVAVEGPLLVVVADDVLAQLGAERLQQVAQVADDREVAQDGMALLHQVVDGRDDEQGADRGERPQPPVHA